MRLWERVVTTYHEGRYGTLALLVLLILGVIAALVIALAGIGLILAANIENIMGVLVMGGITWGIFYCWAEERRSKREGRENASLLLRQAQTQELQDRELALLHSNYNIVRQILYVILQTIASVINVVKPETLSELDSPAKTITKNGIYMYQFLLLCTGVVDPVAIREIIQTRICQKLDAGELNVVNTQFIYNGQAYPILCVDEVTPVGNYLQIDLAWASERYCELAQLRREAKLQEVFGGNRYDRDF